MKYILDSDICISLLKNRFSINTKIKSVGIDSCFISEITLAELIYGAHYSDNFVKHRTEVTRLTSLFSVIPAFDSFDFFGQEKTRLRKRGDLIPDFDLLKEAKVMLNLGLAGDPPSPVYERLLQLHLDILDKEELRKKETKPTNESIASMMGILRKLPAEVRQQTEDFVESLATKYLRVH